MACKSQSLIVITFLLPIFDNVYIDFPFDRQVMISSHHNRIEQLRESFKKKMEEADAWPEKV